MRRLTVGASLTRVVKNVGFITAATLGGRVLNLALHATLARAFGAEGLGGYAIGIALAGYFVFLADLGVSPRLIREGAVAPKQLGEEYRRAVGIKLFAASLSLLALVPLYHVLPYSPWVRSVSILLCIGAVIRSFSYLNEAVCRAKERLDLESYSVFGHSVIFVAATLAAYALGFPVWAIGVTSIGAFLMQLALSSWFAGRYVRLGAILPPRVDTARAAIPYGATTLTVLAFSQVDVLIISVISTEAMVGEYTLVSRLLLVVGSLAALAGAAVLPTATRIFAGRDTARFGQLVNEGLRCVLLLGGGAAIAVVVLARFLVQTIYGPEFDPLHSVLQLGCVFMLPKFAVSALGILLTSCGRQGNRARAILVGLAFTVVLVALLVPLYGVAGGILAMVLSELILFGCLLFYMSDYVSFARLARVTVLVAGALAASAALHWQLPKEGLHLLLAIALPLLCYVALMLASGEVRKAVRFLGVARAAANR